MFSTLPTPILIVTLILGLPVMVLPTPVLRRTMLLWTLSRYLMVTVKIFMETSTKKIQQKHLAVNVYCKSIKKIHESFQNSF